jgi:acyl-CoA synthetase (AMP-forming)/AMP-acid ligase II
MLVLEPAFKKIDFPAILAEVDAAAAQSVERVAIIRPASAMPPRVFGKPTVAFDAFDRAVPDVPDRSDPEAIAALFTTSGTTKGPKLVMHPQRSIAYHARAVARGFGLDAANSRALAAIPFCGVFGFDLALGALAAGAPAVIMDAFEARGAVELVAQHRVTHLFGSDEMARRMMELVPGHDPFPSLRLFGYAAFQPGSAELGKTAWARRVPLVGLYGSSEAQALFAFQPPTLPIDERIEPGGLPVAGSEAEIRVRDVDSGELVESGRSGEIEIRAPSLFAGYCNDAEATVAALHADGFFRTGDIGRLRDDGTLRIRDATRRCHSARRLSGEPGRDRGRTEADLRRRRRAGRRGRARWPDALCGFRHSGCRECAERSRHSLRRGGRYGRLQSAGEGVVPRSVSGDAERQRHEDPAQQAPRDGDRALAPAARGMMAQVMRTAYIGADPEARP